MLAYRISKAKFIEDLSGEGARRYGGRWNIKGTAVLYTSEHQSLAVLETLVHSSINALPTDLKLLTLSIPDHINPITYPPDSLPDNWRSYPAPRSLAELGTQWCKQQSSLVMCVPSVLAPTDDNLLINPSHPAFSQLKTERITEFTFDDRLT
ncbi:MAG: RES family NAD+ phosphorylase [Bacteroidota bacterium]